MASERVNPLSNLPKVCTNLVKVCTSTGGVRLLLLVLTLSSRAQGQVSVDMKALDSLGGTQPPARSAPARHPDAPPASVAPAARPGGRGGPRGSGAGGGAAGG